MFAGQDHRIFQSRPDAPSDVVRTDLLAKRVNAFMCNAMPIQKHKDSRSVRNKHPKQAFPLGNTILTRGKERT
jgi:hypothetical protein